MRAVASRMPESNRRNDKHLRLIVSVDKDSNMQFMNEAPVVLPDPTFTLKFEFTQDLRGNECRTLTVHMRANYRNNDERFREELLASKYLDGFNISSMCHLWDEHPGPISTEIIDPMGVLPWIFPGMDINEFFNQNLLEQ